MVTPSIDQDLPGGYIVSGLKEGGIDYAQNPNNEVELRSIKDKIEALKKLIIQGVIVPPKTIEY